MGHSMMALHRLMQFTQVECTAEIRRVPASREYIIPRTADVANLSTDVFLYSRSKCTWFMLWRDLYCEQLNMHQTHGLLRYRQH